MDVRLKRISGGFLWLAVLALCVSMAAFPDTAHAQPTGIEGTVLDASDGSALIGANVAVRAAGTDELAGGTATNPDGRFTVTGLDPGDYLVEVRFVGYQAEQREVTVERGSLTRLTIEMDFQTASLEQVVVSASRRQEKILDAPASISVLEPQDIQAEVSASSVEVLRATPGVDMAQTGIDRREVVIRGFNEAFSGSAFVLTDYRQASVPSLGVNVHSIMPNMAVDVERVEVVRGPGSALYGPGVTSGVIHYFTKDPFSYPGTTIAVQGGSRQFFGLQGRHAGVIGENLGYKITGQFARANDWQLDPGDAPDLAEIQRYRVYQDVNDPDLDGREFEVDDFDGDGEDEARLRRKELYQKLNVNGLLQYKTGDNTTISLNAGYSELTGVVQSGIGTLQAEGFGYTYGQLRLQSGGLFAQSFVNLNDAGTETFVYGGGNLVRDQGIQINNQVQYDFILESISTQFITGADSDITIPRTNEQIVGRNEDDDRIEEYGAYAQSTTDLSEKFALTLAARADYNNVVEAVQFSPRAALVFKATPSNTFRGSYNRSFSSPGTNSLFLDVEAQRQTLGNAPPGAGFESFDLVFQGLGAADGYTFEEFRSGRREVRFFIPTGQDPFDFGNLVNLETYPVAAVYGATAQGFNPEGEFTGALGELSDQALQAYAQLLGALAQDAASGPLALASESEGEVVLGIPNDNSPLGYRVVDGPVDIAPIEQTTTQTFEIGYKGVLGDRLIVQADGYYEIKRDFIGPLVIESPLAYLSPTGFVAADVQARIASDPQSGGAFQQFVQASGLSQQDAIELLAGTFGSTPTGVVQPDQDVLTGNPLERGDVGGFLSYRNFGEVAYYGADISLTLQATDALSIFANASFISDDFFDNEELDETNTSLSLALNAPPFKFKSGFDYRLDNGFSFGMTSNYVEGFPVDTGPYVGEVESYFLLDARVGYDLPQVPGLSVNVTGKNILNNEHREFAGAPELGAAVFARMQYTF